MFTVKALEDAIQQLKDKFQNISCLRLRLKTFLELEYTIIFQNISCLRLSRHYSLQTHLMEISKHFMFTVKLDYKAVRQFMFRYFKTFHVYG